MTKSPTPTKILVERAGSDFHVYRNADRPGADVNSSCALTETVIRFPGDVCEDDASVGAAMGWFGDWCVAAGLRPVFAA